MNSIFAPLLVFGMVLSACTLKPKSNTKLYIDISHVTKSLARERKLILNDDPVALAFPTAPSPSTPASIGGFTCLALNVIGPGIPARHVAEGDEPPNVIFSKAKAGAPMTYPGVVSTPISYTPGPKIIEMTVPSGGSRLVQLIGLVDNGDQQVNNFCASAGPFPTSGALWEVGRGFLPNAFQDVALSLTQDFSGASQQTWHQEAKRMFGSGSCLAYAGFYETGGTVASSAGVAFAIALDPAPNPTALNMNDVLIEVTAPASVEIGSVIYQGANAITGQMTIAPSAFLSSTGALGTELVAAGNHTFNFRYPTTLVTEPPAGTFNYLVIYSVDGVTQFSMAGRSTGSLPAPMGLAYEKANSGTAWAAMTGCTPYSILSRCY